MNTLRLRLLQGGLAVGALLYTAIASADQGTIVLVTGQVLVGEVQQVVTGEYILVTLPSGEVKAIAWAQIGSFQVGGSATVSTGNQTAPAPPVYAPAPPSEPVYAPPPPPPPNYYGAPPPPPPPPAPTFTPAWMIGVRFGSLVPTGDITGEGATPKREMGQYTKSGWSFEADVGVHLSPAWTFYGLWEYGALGRGDANNFGGENSTMNTLGAGANANTSPHGPVGFLIDGAIGYRWFSFSSPGSFTDANGLTQVGFNKVIAEGAAFRLGMGLAIAPTKKFRVDVLGHMTFSTFRDFKGGGLENSAPGSNMMYGLSVGGRWDL
jgi:hypothetical protein